MLKPHEGGLTLVMQRVIQASPETLFDAWTKAELLRSWFHPRADWTTPEAETDLRVRGAWRAEMRSGQGESHPVFGKYWIVERPYKLVFTWNPFGEADAETLVTLQFRRIHGDSTELTLTHEGLRGEKEKEGHAAGWVGCLEQLGKFVKG